MNDLIQTLRFLLRFSRQIPRARLRMGLIIVTGALGGLLTTALLASINQVLLSFSSEGGAAVSGWAYAGLCVGLVAFSFCSDILLIRLSQKAVFDLRISLSEKLLGLPLRRLEETGTARLLATLTNDVGIIADAFGSLPTLCMNIAVIVGCVAYLIWIAPLAALALMVFMAAGIVSYQVPVMRGIAYKRQARGTTDHLFYHFRGLTEGAKELKLSSRRRASFVGRELSETCAELQGLNVRGDTIFSAVAAWGRVLFFVAIGLCLFVLPSLMETGPGVVLAFSTTLILMVSPLDLILASLPRLGNANASSRRVEEFGLALGTPPSQLAGPGGAANPLDWGRLELDSVVMRYPSKGDSQPFCVGPIDLTLEPGETVFLVGGNGSGKTSLAKVLLGLYLPDEGCLRLSGVEVSEALRENYREFFSGVFADFFLFDRLAGEGDGGDAQRANQILDRLLLRDKVSVDSSGALSTLDLSQGQRKRLALLQALMEDRPVYFFDEWAADQDPFFRRVFYEELLPELKKRGKTVIVISHDDRYFKLADRVIKMSYGRVEHDIRGAVSEETHALLSMG